MDYDEVALYPADFLNDVKSKNTETSSVRLECIEVAAKIRKGEYKIKSKTGRSDVWNTFAAVTNAANEELEGFVLCMSCNKVYKFNKHWTSNLIKHACYRAKMLKLDAGGDSDSGVSQVKRQKHKRKRKDKPIEEKETVPAKSKSARKEDSFWKIHLELHKKLKSGVCKIRHKTGLRSDVWNIFGAIENECGEEVPEAVACQTCYKVYKFNRRWTTNLLKHDCYRFNKYNNETSTMPEFQKKEKNQSFDDSSDEPFINFASIKSELLIDESNYEEQPFINPLTMDNGDSENSSELKEESLLSMSILQKIQNGFYKMINKSDRSEIWQIFAAIENDKGEELPDLIICKTCQLILKYDKKSNNDLCQHKCLQVQEQRFNKSEKQECEQLLMKWLIDDCRHFSLLQDVGFKNFAQYLLNMGANATQTTSTQLQQLLPNVTSLKTHIESSYAKMFTVLKSNLQKIKALGYSINYDLYTDEKTKCSLLALTIHYIIQAQIKTHLLAVQNIKYKYTAFDIQTNLAALLAEFDLELNERVICVSKNLSTNYYARHHVLCINDLLQYCLEKLVVDWPELSYLIEISTNLLKGVKNKSDRELHAIYSQLVMISENWHYLGAKLGKQDESVKIFNLKNIQELVKLLKNFENSSRKLSVEKDATINLVFIHVHNLKKCCLEEAQDSDLIKKAKSLLTYALNNLIVTQLTMFHKIALFLFPPTNKLLQFNDEEKEQIKNSCKYFLMNLIPANTNEPVTIGSQECSIYSDFVEPIKIKLTPVESINTELVNYANQQTIILHDDFDALKWWHLNKSQYPYLYKLSCAILSVPATSVSTERILSKCLQLIHNNSTSSNNSQDLTLINKILFLHVNKIC